jgi:hypothetical protein
MIESRHAHEVVNVHVSHSAEALPPATPSALNDENGALGGQRIFQQF